jgi:DNA-binding CsgD family transcriptional regulator
MGVDEAARSLGLGSATVRTHVKNIYSKTGVQRQSQLVHRALGTALALLA